MNVGLRGELECSGLAKAGRNGRSECCGDLYPLPEALDGQDMRSTAFHLTPALLPKGLHLLPATLARGWGRGQGPTLLEQYFPNCSLGLDTASLREHGPASLPCAVAWGHHLAPDLWMCPVS